MIIILNYVIVVKQPAYFFGYLVVTAVRVENECLRVVKEKPQQVSWDSGGASWIKVEFF